MNDDLPYRTPFNPLPAQQDSSVSPQDENNYSTLKSLHTEFREKLKCLYDDFNAFDILSEGTSAAKRDKMMRQIAGNQIAYDILLPLLDSLSSSLIDIENKWNKGV